MGKIIQIGKKIEKPDKKSLQYLGVVLIIAVLVGIGFFYYYFLAPETSVDEEIFKELQRQRIMKKQMEELAKFREGTEPLTKQETQEQLKELEQTRKKTEPLSEEEMQKQLEELNKFR